MKETLATTKEVAEYFVVKERTVTQKFIKEGLKYIPIGSKDYRYKWLDVYEFEEKRKLQAKDSMEYSRKVIYAEMPNYVGVRKTNEMKVY